MRVQALDAAPCAGNAAVRSRSGVCWGDLRITFCRVRGVRGIKSSFVDFAFGCVDAARGFESRHFDDVVGIDQPISSRHWRAVVKERGVAHHSRHTVGAAYHDGEVALWTSPEQLGHLLHVYRRGAVNGR